MRRKRPSTGMRSGRRIRPRPCENAREPRTRSIVFSLVFLRCRSSVFFVFRADDIEKDFLCAIRELGFLHSLAPTQSFALAAENGGI
jgi:hypothetical protein